MTAPKVLISDKMDPKAAAIFAERGIHVDVITGKTRDELIAMIGAYDGLAIRSATKVTADVLAAAANLKVVGRAGIGVDNVDIPAARSTSANSGPRIRCPISRRGRAGRCGR